MKCLIPLGLIALILGGCTGSRTMYDNNGLKIIQTGADPTPINGGYNVLVVEQNGQSTIVAVTATGTVAEQIAMPAATVAGAAILADQEGDSIVVEGSSAKSRSRSKSKNKNRIRN